MTPFEFQSPVRLVFGEDTSQDLSCHINALTDKKTGLIITDQGIIDAGLLAPIHDQLQRDGFSVELFGKVVADPPEAIIYEAIEAARRMNAGFVIGLGGGSSMDVAKLVAVLKSSSQSLSDIYGLNGVQKAPKCSLILIPTTSGTGSEVTPISVVTVSATSKQGVVDPALYADFAVLDPLLTLGLPANVSAATGIDAMVHAIEAYTSRVKKNPISDGLAISALNLLYNNIRRVISDGNDKQARAAMLLGSMQAGQAFSNAPVAAVHALAYPLGSLFHLSHGLSNAMVLSPVLAFNMPVAHEQYAELERSLDRGASPDNQLAAGAFIARMKKVCADVGIPPGLGALDFKKEAIDSLAEAAMLQGRLLMNNPREVTLDDAKALYQEAM